MKPSVGRIVHYVVPTGPAKGETLAAIITCVHNETCVNLHVYLDGALRGLVREEGSSRFNVEFSERQTSVVQTDETQKQAGCWFWPPRVAA